MGLLARVRRRLGERVFWTLFTVVNLTLFFVGWELFARSGVVSSLFLPEPTRMWTALMDEFSRGDLWGHLGYSARNFAIGVLLAVVIGVPLGLAAGSNRLFYRLLSPYIWGMSSVPRIAWLPLLILIFGFSEMSKLILIFISAVFPMIINGLAGVKTVDRTLLTAGKVFGAKWRHRYVKIVLPHALPYIVSGFKQGMTRALAAVVVSEMFGGSQGIGFVIVMAGQRFNVALLYALLVFIVLAALVIVAVVDRLERRLAPWRTQVAI